MTVGERIKQARLKKGYTQAELAELLGYKSRSSINKIETEGRDIPRSSIVKFANVLDVTPAYLMGWENIENSEIKGISILDSNNICMIPLYETVSAGLGAYADSSRIGFLPMYIETEYDAQNMLAIKVNGDSMYPKIEDGDIIVVRKQSDFDNGDIAVVLIDGDEGLVKKIYYNNEKLTLVSINPEYKDKVFYGSEIERITVVGVVKKVIKEV